MAPIWEHIKGWFKDWRDPLGSPHPFPKISPFWLVVVVTVSLNVWIAAKTQEAYDYTKQVAQQNTVCWRNFAEAMRSRSTITADNDRLFLVQGKAVSELLRDLSVPPSVFNKMTQDEKIAFLQLRAAQAYGVMNQVTNRLETNQNDRQKHPLPDPKCDSGK